ncbi:hypothetical protein MDAP_001514 [Mitosporidium daphniae]
MSFCFGDQIEEHSRKVLRSLSSYQIYATTVLERYYTTLKGLHSKYLSDFLQSYADEKNCIIKNQEFLNAIVANHIDSDSMSHDFDSVNTEYPKSLLKQFMREWSTEGTQERKESFGLILDTLTTMFPTQVKRSQIKVLVPGAGLGRLPYEIIKLGFECQGCEFSEYMLIGSDWILNQAITKYEIFPFIHQRINLKSRSDVIKAVIIPDEFPSLVLGGYEGMDIGSFSMVAGDFLSCYSNGSEKASWHAVVTSYFIDTANNIIDYMEEIYRLLKEGGCWINYGPLLYHFDSHPTEKSVELPLDEILKIAKLIGFKIQGQIDGVKFCKSSYCQMKQSMMKTGYENAFFVAFK